jgi:3-hydroxyacyl-CoA dehydrogenase/enoyl-CoA hydratase/3-hydroxybutyryl-CoA epimerase
MADASVIRWDQGEDRIVVLTLDDPAQSANTMNEAYVRSMAAVVERLEAERDSIDGVIVTSAKPTFFAGGDLRELRVAGKEQAPQIKTLIGTVKDQLRRLETLGRPVVAALNGSALGGGLEIALACHYRIAIDEARTQIGLPEVKLGLLPGGGGVVRSVRLLGLVDALRNVLLEGKAYRPSDALSVGLLDELVDDAAALLPAARSWIADHPDAVQPWDRPDYEMPGGHPSSPALAAMLPAFPATLRKQIKGANYPAPHHILAAAVEGAQVDFASASEIEGRYFLDLVTGQVAKNMIQAFFFDMQKVNGSRGRPNSAESFNPAKMIVLGAGMMGSAIAFVCARAGIDVALKDVSLDAAQQGKGYAERRLAREVETGRSTQAHAEEVLARITPTDDPAAAAGAELVVEAVFEDPGLKRQVISEIEPHLASGALLASNTSSLPITSLAEGAAAPANFIGLHFFSPVDKMPLLEIIRGAKTSDQTLYQALDFAKRIRKTPIVVNDSRGFFTSRVISTFIYEGISMLAEGVPAPSIEQASSQAGYPAPVLQLSDELNLKLLRKVRDASKAATEASGTSWDAHPAEVVIDRMLDEFERPGRLEKAGFYEYENGTRARLWPGLRGLASSDLAPPPFDDLKERMLFIEALEAVKCLDEGVITSVADANVGSILGIGFPGWTGGVLQYVNGYDGGVAGFVARARELAAVYGPRFEPPASVAAKAETSEKYGDAEG